MISRVSGFIKTDLLALGMLTCLHRCFDLIRATAGTALTLDRIPLDDPSVYDMFCARGHDGSLSDRVPRTDGNPAPYAATRSFMTS